VDPVPDAPPPALLELPPVLEVPDDASIHSAEPSLSSIRKSPTQQKGTHHAHYGAQGSSKGLAPGPGEDIATRKELPLPKPSAVEPVVAGTGAGGTGAGGDQGSPASHGSRGSGQDAGSKPQLQHVKAAARARLASQVHRSLSILHRPLSVLI